MAKPERRVPGACVFGSQKDFKLKVVRLCIKLELETVIELGDIPEKAAA